HPVIVADGTESQNGGDFGYDFTLEVELRAELVAGALVHQQNDSQLPLLNVTLDKRVPHSGGDIPVNGTDVVAWLVFAVFLERISFSFEDVVVFATHHIVHGAASTNLEPANLANYLPRKHGRIIPDLLRLIEGNYGLDGSPPFP